MGMYGRDFRQRHPHRHADSLAASAAQSLAATTPNLTSPALSRSTEPRSPAPRLERSTDFGRGPHVKVKIFGNKSPRMSVSGPPALLYGFVNLRLDEGFGHCQRRIERRPCRIHPIEIKLACTLF